MSRREMYQRAKDLGFTVTGILFVVLYGDNALANGSVNIISTDPAKFFVVDELRVWATAAITGNPLISDSNGGSIGTVRLPIPPALNSALIVSDLLWVDGLQYIANGASAGNYSFWANYYELTVA